MKWVAFWTMQNRNARILPASIPLSVAEEDILRNTADICLSVIPMAFRVPITEILRKSIIRSEEIMLKPATATINTNTISTLKSIRSSQENICG